MDTQDSFPSVSSLTAPVPLPSKIRKKYTEEALQKSVTAVTSKGMTLGQASKYYGIPKSTIKFRLGSKWTKKFRRGPNTILTLQEELTVVKRIQDMERRGFPITKHALMSRVKAFLDKNPRKNLFKNNKPGLKWLQLFLGRHKQISMREPEKVTKAAATVAESDIRSWFAKIRQYMRDNNLEHIFTDPRRILIGDETMFLLDPVTRTVVTSKGNRKDFLVQQADTKKNVTVLFTFDAEGHMFDPEVVLPYKRISQQLCLSFDPDWGIGKSETGWMDGDNFVGHIKNQLHPALVRRNVPFPVIYFVEGHPSHTGLEAAEACAELGILLIALYPNVTHVMQPADVAIFKPLKNSWNKCVDEWKMRNDGRLLPILDFGGVLKEAINQGISTSIVRSGFQKCGLYPFDADAVNYSRCLAISNQGDNVINDSSTSDAIVPIKKRNIEECIRMINTTRIKSFIGQADENTLEDSEKVLLHIYKSLLMEYDEDARIESANGSGMKASICENYGQYNEATVKVETNVPPHFL